MAAAVVQSGRLFLAAGVAIAMVVILGRALGVTRRNVDMLSSAPIRLVQQQETDRYNCLEAAMRARIPAGSVVVDEGADGVEYQRVAEELTPGFRFVASPVPGAYRVAFTAFGPCGGMGVVVTRVPTP
jgi:hypothetical protein